MNIMYQYEFDEKYWSNRCIKIEYFLKKELLRSKNKLGQIISQKKLIEEKLKFSFLEEIIKEEKLLRILLHLERFNGIIIAVIKII